MSSGITYRRVLRLKETELQEMQRIIDMDKETFRLTGITPFKLLRLYDIDFQDGYKVKLWIHAGAITGEVYERGHVVSNLINSNDNKVGEALITYNIEGQYMYINNNRKYFLDIIGE